MKTTFDLPSDLVHAIKLRAVHENPRFKEVAAELLCSAIGQGKSPIPLLQKGPIKLPLFDTTPGAPASQMSATALIALEQTHNSTKTMPTTASPYDTGVSLALAFAIHPFHQKARAVFEPADSCQPAAFCRANQATFLRLLTVKSICDAHGCDPIPNSKAWAKCTELLHLPQVTWLEEPSEVELEWGHCATLSSASPKIWMDAYLAAFAIRSGISLLSIDNNFVRVEPQGLQFRLLPRDWVLEALDGICFKATDCSAQMSARYMDVGPETLKKAHHHFPHGVSPSLAVA